MNAIKRKRGVFCILLLVMLLLSGCNNEFAREEYDLDQKIAEKNDRYSKTASVLKSNSERCSLTASKFAGRETLWSITLVEEQEVEAEFLLSLSEGKAKIVHIDNDEVVTTIMECDAETATDGLVTKTISLKRGKNRIKIVGYDCKELEVQMLFEDMLFDD